MRAEFTSSFAATAASEAALNARDPHRSAVYPGPGAGMPLVSLSANSLIQFFDFEVAATDLVGISRDFLNTAAAPGEAPALYALANSVEHAGGNIDVLPRHPVTGEALDAGDVLHVEAAAAFPVFCGHWLPVPFLRAAALTGSAADPAEGPSNWVRVFIANADPTTHHGGKKIGGKKNAAGGNGSVAVGSYHVVLAFDTRITAERPSARLAEVAPTETDVAAGTRFMFSDAIEDIEGFLSEPWVDDWLRAVARRSVNGSLAAPGDAPAAHGDGDGGGSHDSNGNGADLTYLAQYLCVLTALKKTCDFAPVRLMSRTNTAHETVPVDLVLDMGAARTCAVLVEAGVSQASVVHAGAAGTSAAGTIAARLLPVRDFDEPWRTHFGLMPAACVFMRADFGPEALSRMSGRSTAFAWPSLVRIGVEAARLAVSQPVDGRETGLARPAAALWDERPHGQIWRFASAPPEHPQAGLSRASLSYLNKRTPFVSGALLSHLREDGELVSPDLDVPATKARFSRSSLTTLAVHELVLHALSAIDAPHIASAGAPPVAQSSAARPRRLSRILVSMPLSLHARERTILQKRIQAAVDLAWQSLGWSARAAADVPHKPAIQFVSDAASGQIRSILHNEITYRFGGQHDAYFELAGTPRARYNGAASLRVASIDIGERATTLSVATAVGSLGPTAEPVLTAECADSTTTGTGSVLDAIVRRLVVPALVDALRDAGLVSAQSFIDRLLAARGTLADPEYAQLAERVADDLLAPAAAGILAEHLAVRGEPSPLPVTRRLGDCLGDGAEARSALTQRFDDVAITEGAAGFAVLNTLIRVNHAALAALVERVMAPMLTAAARIVRALDCDNLILSGAGSRLPCVRAAFVAAAAVRPDRIIDVHSYRFAAWMPERDAAGRVGDSKISATIGCALSYLSAAGSTHGTSVFTGVLDDRCLLKNDRIGFATTAGDHFAARDLAREHTVAFSQRLIIGARRIEAEAWPATPLHTLDVDDPDAFKRLKLPLKVTLGWQPSAGGRSAHLTVLRIVDAEGRSAAPSVLALRYDPSAREASS